MNICILTRPDLVPTNHGAAVKIVKTAQSFVQLGHSCSIVTEDRDGYWVVSASGDLTKKKYPMRFRAVQEWPLIRGGSRRAEWFCRWLGYPEEEFFLYMAQFDPAWLVRLVSVGLTENVDVFQAEFPGYGIVGSIAARMVSKISGRQVRSSIVQHNVEWDRLTEYGHSSSWIRRMESLALQVVDDVIAVSESDKQIMQTMGIASSSITVIPHGVDVQAIQRAQDHREHWRRRYRVQDKRVLFFHGTLHYAPNTDAVRFIATELLPLMMQDSQFNDVIFVVTGMNPPLYYDHPRIVYTGAVDDLAGHLHMADAFVCPLFAGGGTRLKLLEYLATGKPIVTTQKGAEGIPNQGQFEYAETASDFISALLRVFEMDAKSKPRRHFATRLAWQTVTQEYIRLYQRDSHVRGSNRFNDLLSRQHALGQETLHLPSYTPTKPRTLLFLINRGCNLRCSFCDLWDNPQNISLEQVGPILDDAVAIGTKIVVLTGGEPLMHPDIQAIIRMVKERGMAVNMTTNGLLLRRHWSWIRLSGIDSLSFSIDGLAEVHDLLRGQQGAYDLTMKAIQTVLDESRIPCSVYCTVTNKNVHQLADLHQMFWQMGVGFDFWPVNDAPDLYLTSEEHKTLWVQAVSKITERDLVYASRQSFYADSLRYHDGQVVDNRRCLGFVEQYGIKYNGDLLPCCVWEGDGLVVGNVFETSLKDLWHSEKVQGVRQSMVEDGCHVPCFNHSLYEFRTAVRG